MNFVVDYYKANNSSQLDSVESGFSLDRLDIGWGTSAGGQSVNGGTYEGGHRPYGGGDLTLIDYIIN